MITNKKQLKHGSWYELTDHYREETSLYQCKVNPVTGVGFQCVKDGGILPIAPYHFNPEKYTFKEVEGNDALNAEMKQSIERCNRIYEWCSKNTCD